MLEVYLQPGRLDPSHAAQTIIYHGFSEYDEWLEHTELLGKFLNRLVFAGNPIAALEQIGWEKDPTVLRELLMRKTDYPWGVPRIVLKILLRDGLWEEAPQLVSSILKQGVSNRFEDVQWMLKLKNLSKHPEVMMTVLDRMGMYYDDSDFLDQLSHSGWADHPEVLQYLFRKKFATVQRVAILKNIYKIFEEPKWTKYPEVIEEFALLAPVHLDPDDIAKVLAMPHWLNLPQYQHLRGKDGISYSSFKKYVLAKSRSDRNLGVQLLGGCIDFFGGFLPDGL